MSLLGNRIKQLRLKNNLTQSALGKMINVTKVSICGYEKGTRYPSLDTLMDLSEVFKVDIDYLLGADNMIISDNDSDYGIKVSNEEIIFIKELRKNNTLYEQIISNPKRVAELINKKLK